MGSDQEVTHEFREVNGIRMHVALAGSGPPIILLHGFPEIWYSWRKLIPLLSRDYRVIVPDLRGYGQTEITDRGYDLNNLGKDVLDLIERVGEPVVLAGHDWGGVIGWHVASVYPEKVRAYFAVAGPHPARFFELLMKSPRQLLMSYYTFFFQLPVIPEKLLSMNRAEVAARIMQRSAANPGSITNEDLDVYRETWTFERMRAGINYYRMLGRRPFWPRRFYRNNKAACPVCVVWAEKDFALSTAQTQGLERWCERPPEVHIIPDCGHWIPQEKPEEFHRIIMEFLAKNPE